eukprot:403346075
MATGFGCMVVGSAGSGKSTFCQVLQESGETHKRVYKVCNLDPAAEVFKYKCDIDIRDLISLDDVQEELKYGPNGGLIYCMEYLIEHIDWLMEELNEFAEDSFILFDCPGQIELYSHLDVMTRLTRELSKTGFFICAVYCADGTFINEPTKYISACFTSLSTMTQLSIPHINILTKCDKMDPELIEKVTNMPTIEILNSINSNLPPKFYELNTRIVEVIDNFNMVQYVPLNIQDEESIDTIMQQIDSVVQYDEFRLPKESLLPNDDGNEDDQEDGDGGDMEQY